MADLAAGGVAAAAGDAEVACGILDYESGRLLGDRAQSIELQAMIAGQIAKAAASRDASEQTADVTRLLERLIERERLFLEANERTRVNVDIALTSLCG